MIREWARAQGFQVAERGLIPRHIVEAYKTAHGIPAERPERPVWPEAPAKPRITFGGDCWALDDGHALILFDTWPEALDAAGRICHDYRRRLTDYLLR